MRPAPLGLLIDGSSIQNLVQGDASKSVTQTTDVQTLLENNGVTPVSSSLYVDLNALLGSLDPNYGFSSHDKIEGVAGLNGGRELVIGNDTDFWLSDFDGTGINASSPPFHLIEKFSPVTGQEGNGECLAIDPDRVNPTTGADEHQHWKADDQRQRQLIRA